MSNIKFGTDGWRAVIGEGFTFANLDRVSQATADYWLANPDPGAEKRVIVGYDRRFLSDQFAQRVSEVMAGNGFEVILTNQPTPTPAVSLAVKARKAQGGVMLTASHNPAIFNGFKLKSFYGGSSEPSTCQGVEALIDQSPVKSATAGILRKDLKPAHYKAVKALVDFKTISRYRARLAHDPLFGVGAGCFDDLLNGTACKVTTLNAEHDPLFGGINPEPVPANYDRTTAYLQKHPHDLCVVTDGDADRVGGMDGRGNPLSTHQLICLLLQHLVKNRGGKGRFVKALTTTSMTDKMCAAYGLELVETGVGFKYICAEMIRGNVLLGAEESGGIGFQGHIPERDGILSGLMLLEMLAYEKKPITKLLERLEKDFGPHRYTRIDTHFPLEKRAALMTELQKNPPGKLLRSPLKEIKAYDGVKYISEDGSWLMLRGSGTEPVLRIYAESSTDAGARKLVEAGLARARANA